jgi:hypothetical protein
MKGERPSVFVDWLISGAPQLEGQGRNQCPMLVSTIVRVHQQSAFCVCQARIQSLVYVAAGLAEYFGIDSQYKRRSSIHRWYLHFLLQDPNKQCHKFKMQGSN